MQHIYWIHIKPVWVVGAGGDMAPPDIVRSIYPPSTGGKPCPTNYYWTLPPPPPDFQSLLRPCICSICRERIIKKQKLVSTVLIYSSLFFLLFKKYIQRPTPGGNLSVYLDICPTTNRWSKLQQYLFSSIEMGSRTYSDLASALWVKSFYQVTFVQIKI